MSTPTRQQLLAMHCDDLARIQALEEKVTWQGADIIDFNQRISALEGRVPTVEPPQDDRITGFAVAGRSFRRDDLVLAFTDALEFARQHLPAEEVYACCANGAQFKALLICDPKGDFFANADELPRVTRD